MCVHEEARSAGIRSDFDKHLDGPHHTMFGHTGVTAQINCEMS